MGLLDDLKKAAVEVGSVAKAAATEFVDDAGQRPEEGTSEDPQPELLEDGAGPGKLVKKAIMSVATTLRATSDKTMMVLIKRFVQPTDLVSADSIYSGDEVGHLLESSAHHNHLDAQQLIRAATNSFDTLDDARNRLQEEIAKVDEGANTEEPHEDVPAWHELLGKLIAVLGLIRDGKEDEAESCVAESDDAKLVFDHALVARFMINRLQARSAPPDEIMFWCDIALYYDPLDKGLMDIAGELRTSEDNSLLQQLSGLVSA